MTTVMLVRSSWTRLASCLCLLATLFSTSKFDSTVDAALVFGRFAAAAAADDDVAAVVLADRNCCGVCVLLLLQLLL